MKPDSAIIYFTVCSGTGYGMIMSLILLIFNNDISPSLNIKIIIAFISLFLIISGLFASTVHLGHPLRAWRALSQWKSSWLSREGVLALLTFIPLTIFFVLWIFLYNFTLVLFFLTLSGLFSLITVFSTAMIYSSLKTIPAWNNNLVPPIYILNSLVVGSLLNYTIFNIFNLNNLFLSKYFIVISIIALLLKMFYWISIKKNSNTNISTATGLGNHKKISLFEAPHSGNNFLTSEMINKISESKSFILRLIFCIFSYVTPAYYLFQQPNLVTTNYINSITLVIISIFALLGMFIERYLFFIDSKHTVSLYYGNKTI